ncbi:FecR domain-containing protein [Sphingobium sp. AN558]|uniref:FecR family protein n=1 Tax=Sphingobium sp. AN558 TaxID=3133442 RepID=UPI0030BACD35
MNDDPIVPPDDAGANPLLEEAIAWCLRMHGEGAEAHRAAFEAWLALGGVHRQIYSEVSELYGFGETLRDMKIERVSESVAANDQSGRSSHWRAPALLGAAIVAIAAGGLFVHQLRQERAIGEPLIRTIGSGQLQTALGEIRSVRLDDGLTVTLDTDSLVTVAADGHGRRLRLERGRARFAVSRDRTPLVVTAGLGTITGLGTIFDVGLSSYHAVNVSAVQGAVDVRASDKWWALRRTRTLRVTAGHRWRYGPDEHMTITRMSREDLSADAWPSGLMAFDGVPLSQVIGQANRYGVTKIVLADAALGERRFHGTLRLNDTRKLATVLAHAFSLRIVEEPGTLGLSAQ